MITDKVRTFWKNWFTPKEKFDHPHNKIHLRRNMEFDIIRTKIEQLGWNITERPARRRTPGGTDEISHWKLTAVRGERSYTIEGKTIQEAMETLGTTLGAISRR